jgi:hypothetical protein
VRQVFSALHPHDIVADLDRTLMKSGRSATASVFADTVALDTPFRAIAGLFGNAGSSAGSHGNSNGQAASNASGDIDLSASTPPSSQVTYNVFKR